MNHSVIAGVTIQSADSLCCSVCGAASEAHHDWGAPLGDSRFRIGVDHTLPSWGGVHDSFDPITIQVRNTASASHACWRHAGLPGRSTKNAPSAATVISVAPM